ncbi:CPBP family intramembrane glutamic endopeptidase [Haloplanus rubicundus]|uniref:CPBP family intramembrane metalloprotease n=1 Tax=Haloplanus rubicundus TaxID=1547898 RepID=A0A345EEB4_9EURY|nr:CPBP family intramembrane glutamic endopeptidase [Haloplanus rubicundus]AXG10536.1 CPBP family intramembrane metalloprotease [Haloplanus rubicundus]
MSQQRIRGIVDARPVATFFFFAYAFSWIGWFPVVIGMGEPIRTLSFIAGGFGPALAGAVVTWLDGESVRAWTRQIVRWRVAARWYLAAFLLPLLVVSLASVVIVLLGTTVDPTVLSGRLSLVLGSYVFVALIGGGNEEPGWRGFALSRLEERYAPVPATLILGVVWAFWHLPQLVADPNAVYSFAWLAEEIPGIVLRVINIVGFAFLLTWIYNGTASVLLALLLHAGINTANSTLVPLPIEAITGESFMTVLIAVDLAVWVVAIVLIVATRGHLGYGTTRNTAGRQEFR